MCALGARGQRAQGSGLGISAGIWVGITAEH